ncbi:hypothetical protein RJ640_005475 [Escallonia rubra]|uniref:Uncharacterized protein n=1 Tax=Escallonia rubra TaxID=112253 RepID=A0AA88RJG5_9ASTE|nr:hypothetical protein RJ640_005475 [Escallonia rubra]
MISPEENGSNWLLDYGMLDDISVPGGDLPSLGPGFTWPSDGFTGSTALSAEEDSFASLDGLHEYGSRKRFVELSSILEPGRPPKMDKVALLGDAVQMVNQLRNEAQKLKDSFGNLQKSISELKTEKSELRDEKQRLKADKEKLAQQVKGLSNQASLLPHPSVVSASFAAPRQVIASKMVPFFGYPGVSMWQYVPSAAVIFAYACAIYQSLVSDICQTPAKTTGDMVSPEENPDWLFDYGLIEGIPVPGGDLPPLEPGFHWPSNSLSGPIGPSLDFVDTFANSEGEGVKESGSRKRFQELSSILEPGRPPKMDKVVILSDAGRMVSQLRDETQKLKESCGSLQEKINELKAEKNELRDEKQKLKAEKEKLERQLKGVIPQPGFLPPPSAMPAPFALPGQVVGSKLVPFVSYPGVSMWQFMPPAAVDTSEDHVLRPPVA